MTEPEPIDLYIDLEKFNELAKETERKYTEFMHSPLGKLLADWDPEKED